MAKKSQTKKASSSNWLTLSRLTIIAVAFFVFLVLAYAIYHGDHRHASNAPTPTPSPSIAASPSPTSTPTPSAPIPTSTPITECSTASLAGSLDATGGGTAGTQYRQLILTNRGTTTCTVQGFPGVSLVDAAGTQLGSPAARDGAAGALITLAPGASAASAVGFPDAGNFAPGTCSTTSTNLKVYPPNQTAALLVSLATQACPGFSVQTLTTH